MGRRVRSHVTYSNVMVTILAFIVLGGGSALALSGSNTVFSDDIVDGEVKSADVANGGVTSPDVRDDTATGGGLGAADLKADSVGTSEVIDNSLTGSDVSGITGFDVSDNSLTGSDITESSFIAIKGAGNAPGCNPSSSTFVSCAEVSLTLSSTATSDVLVEASGDFLGVGVGADTGSCKLTRGTANSPTNSAFSDPVFLDNSGGSGSTVGFARNGVDQSVPGGTTTWKLMCNRTNGDPLFTHLQMTAVRLAS